MAKKSEKEKIPGTRLICKNRRVFHDYSVGERFEAGMVLVGTEVKSCRAGGVHLNEAYVKFVGDELFLMGGHIAEYVQANQFNHKPDRDRKLLMHRRELDKIAVKVHQKGFVIVPISMYFKDGRAKVEIGLAKGQKKEDQRQRIKERDTKREIARTMGRRR
jgi:SsrA-binding protein